MRKLGHRGGDSLTQGQTVHGAATKTVCVRRGTALQSGPRTQLWLLTHSVTLEVLPPLWVSGPYCCLLVKENVGKHGIYLIPFCLWHSGILRNYTGNKKGHQNGLNRIISHAERSSWPWFLTVTPPCWCLWLLCRELLTGLGAVRSHFTLYTPWTLPSISQFLLMCPEAQTTCKKPDQEQ